MQSFFQVFSKLFPIQLINITFQCLQFTFVTPDSLALRARI